MRGMRLAIAIVALLLLAPLAAEAVGPMVGTNCVGVVTPPTTYTNGEPLTGTQTLEWYVMSGVQTVPAVPPKFTSAGSPMPGVCAGLAAGQYTLAMADFDVASGLRSGFSNMFPFMLMIPNVPTGFSCTAGPTPTCSWTPPTLYTDNITPIPAGGASTELWVMAATATAPSGPPTLVATGNSVPISPPAGNYNVFARALTTPTPGGNTSESAAVLSPFVVRTPNPGTNLLVR